MTWQESEHPRKADGEWVEKASARLGRRRAHQEDISAEHERRQLILRRSCPTCGAAPGRRCAKPGGGPLSSPKPYHAAREKGIP